MDHAQLLDWADRYEAAWRSPGTDALDRLFTPGATYLTGPYEVPVLGLAAIGQLWEEERDGPDEVFTMTREVVAVDGSTGVLRVEVRYGDPVREYQDLWIVRFAADGRAEWFEEWPYSPGRGSTADTG